MATFDDTDLEILRLLLEDGRRPYSEIADRVGVSPPTVSDRVDRLRQAGVVERFTLDVDESMLMDGVSVLVTLRVVPERTEDVRSDLQDHPSVAHVFTTADGRVYAKAHLDPDEVRTTLSEAVDLDDVREIDVDLLTSHDWTPVAGASAFDIECAECGNTVTDEGTSALLDDTRYHFCCPSCESNFVDRFEDIEAGA